jgi:translation initiation factor 2 subunit 3
MMPSQPEINIGMVGHVDHGKTTLTQALSGIWTDRHSEEIKRGISIKLGYADVAFYKCQKCLEPVCYTTESKCPNCEEKCKLLRVASFVDAPGHEALMAVMLSGAALMDGALLLIAADEPCPQPQTKEHLMALDIIGIKHIVVVQNKIDLVSEQKAIENYKEIEEFIKGTVVANTPIIPLSAHHRVNLDVLIKTIEEFIPTPKRDENSVPLMYCSRSFDVNRPGTPISKLVGGVIGGSLLQGRLKVGDEIEISPGRKIEERGKIRWEPIRTKIASLYGGRPLEVARPSGLLAIGTELDPSLTKGDGLVGRVLGKPNSLPPLRKELTLQVNLLEKVVGAAREQRVEPIKVKESLMLTVGTATSIGLINWVKKGEIGARLKLPLSAFEGQRVAISRIVGGRWHLIGYGIIE